jgi:DNA-binding transcriptional MerR regulator
MRQGSNMGRFRIQVVSRLSGVPPATLRAWERRYGVPSPARTSAAYRLYDESDIVLIRRMRELVESGMAASDAARLVLDSREALASAGALPIVAGGITPQLDVGEPSEPPRVERTLGEGDAFDEAAHRLVDATVRFDPEGVERELARASMLGDALTVFTRVFTPALRRIGDLWHAGELTVAQEHVTSQALGSTLGQLLRLVQPPDAKKRVVLACFADEEHQIPLYGVGLRFAGWGYRSVLLGARTPPAAIARVVDKLAPEVVALSITVSPLPSRARELVDDYADACRGTTWIVGGAAAESVRPFVVARGGLVVDMDLDLTRAALERAQERSATVPDRSVS